MRRSLSILAAAVIGITGALAGIAPAQAGAIRAAPAVLDQSGPSAGIVQVHKRHRAHRHARKHHHHHYAYKRPYYPRYVKRYYHPYAYYPRYYSRPGVSIQFSFGGGHHYRHW